MKIFKKICMVSALACLTFAVPVSAADVTVSTSPADFHVGKATPETSNKFSMASDPSGSYTLKPWETRSFSWLYPGDGPIRFEVNQQGVLGGVAFLKYQLYKKKNGDWEPIKDYSIGGNGFHSDSIETEPSTFYRLDITNVMYYSGTTDVKIDVQFYNLQY
ncbi:hypothetical protein [Paenibacillus elgii]|uniref:Secreted protein n=1 Tax=Paenibacillus elgii TaxID=189691 RepID=A0A163XXS4_9BACL|nr:hypothetical protein [Paenibacillus elgii]KZE78611.1 hypothetical protein AV654_02340 [Paenibacillus elgii]MCM3267840.1 hypothetical protein [Paenibacillus elgii]NEN84875.1 hypothetical protein [Paenibacillus elgii]